MLGKKAVSLSSASTFHPQSSCCRLDKTPEMVKPVGCNRLPQYMTQRFLDAPVDMVDFHARSIIYRDEKCGFGIVWRSHARRRYCGAVQRCMLTYKEVVPHVYLGTELTPAASFPTHQSRISNCKVCFSLVLSYQTCSGAHSIGLGHGIHSSR